MARIRTIKPEFWRDEKPARCSRDARLLFIGMLNEADDTGRLLGSAKNLAGTIFPLDSDATEKKVEVWIGELLAASLIADYVVEGIRYFQVCNFRRHQHINRPSPPKYPSPPGGLTPDSVSDSRSDSLSDAGVTHDTLQPGREGKGKRNPQPPAPDGARGHRSCDPRHPSHGNCRGCETTRRAAAKAVEVVDLQRKRIDGAVHFGDVRRDLDELTFQAALDAAYTDPDLRAAALDAYRSGRSATS